MGIKSVTSITLTLCVVLSSCTSGTVDKSVLINAPDRSFLGFVLNKPINLPPCLSKTDEVQKTCIQGNFIYLQPDEIPSFMEGNAIFISTTKNGSLTAGPQYFEIRTKFEESEAVLTTLREKYGAEDLRQKSQDDKVDFTPVWYWTFADLEVQHLNFEDRHMAAVFTKDIARERAAQAEEDYQQWKKSEEKKRAL